jgi:hypothetical protein
MALDATERTVGAAASASVIHLRNTAKEREKEERKRKREELRRGVDPDTKKLSGG